MAARTFRVPQYRLAGNITGATKANPCVLTLDAVDTRCGVGSSVYVTGTGWTQLDGKWFAVSAKAGSTITLTGADTSAAVGTVIAGQTNMQY
jgi:hypothetical protein